MTAKTWLRATLLFFAWGFVMHSVGLLLHEFGGHALAYATIGCGVARYDLTFFGHGQVFSAPCTEWTWAKRIVADWAGLVVTIATGLAAAAVLRRKKDLSPMARVLVALVVFFFLLGQLGYIVSGGFHDLYDPRRTSLWLGEHGAHVLAWLPGLLAYAVAAWFGATRAVDAFRLHFASRTRLATVKQLVATLGAAGILYYACFWVEWKLRADMVMKGVATEAKRVAVAKGAAPPFPIEHVLTAVGVAALVYALARPMPATVDEPAPLSPATVRAVAASTAVCALAMLILVLRR